MSIDDGMPKGVRLGLKPEQGTKPTPTQLESAPSAASAAASGSFSRRTHSPFFSSQPAGLDDGLGRAEAGEADEQATEREIRSRWSEIGELTLFPHSTDLCGRLG